MTLFYNGELPFHAKTDNFTHMDKSLQIRKQKAIARRRDKKLLAAGKLRVEQVSLAAALKVNRKSPLIYPKIRFPDDETG